MAPANLLMFTGLAISTDMLAFAQAMMKDCSNRPVASITTRVTLCFLISKMAYLMPSSSLVTTK
jgi:hypothetical protein